MIFSERMPQTSLYSMTSNFSIIFFSFPILFQDTESYEEWKVKYYPTMADVLREFPSVRASPTFLLSQLPLLQPRFYSISSSPLMHPGEIHATVAVVKFKTQGEIIYWLACLDFVRGRLGLCLGFAWLTLGFWIGLGLGLGLCLDWSFDFGRCLCLSGFGPWLKPKLVQ